MGNGRNPPPYHNPFCSMVRNHTDRLAPAGVSFGDATTGSPLSQNRQVCADQHTRPATERTPGQLPEQESLGLRCAHYRQAAALSSGGNTSSSSSILTHQGEKKSHLNIFSVDNEAVYLILFG